MNSPYFLKSLCVICLIVILFMFLSLQKQTAQQAFLMNVPYEEARKVILSNGWMPVQHNKLDDDIGIHAVALRNKGYIEVDDCSGTGMGYCAFHFQDENGVFLVVTTQEVPFGNVKTKFKDQDTAIVINYGVTDRLN